LTDAADAGDGALALPDLASRALRGSVVAASDEFFAEKENLILPGAPAFTPRTYGHKGQVYDGWETRRGRGPSGSLPADDVHDWVIVRLGAAGVVRAVVVDTAHFTGNYPQSCSVEGACVAGYRPVTGDTRVEWVPVVARSPLKGDARHVFGVPGQLAGRRFTHVRLRIYPDGGVARLRVHGVVVPSPTLLEGLTFDLAALENDGDVVACSDRFYSSPRNVISPGLPRVMGEGWETRRRREPGSEWLVVRLTGHSVVSLAEIDTSGYIGNAPGSALLSGIDSVGPPLPGSPLPDSAAWFPLLPRTALLPDTPHRFRPGGGRPVTHVRLSVFPDGGIARLRLHGSLTHDGLAAVQRRWEETGPSAGLPVRGGRRGEFGDGLLDAPLPGRGGLGLVDAEHVALLAAVGELGERLARRGHLVQRVREIGGDLDGTRGGVRFHVDVDLVAGRDAGLGAHVGADREQ
jgi:allantoicase